jgi:hypothetical protein
MTDEVSFSGELLDRLLPNRRAFFGRHRGGDLLASQLSYVAIQPTNEFGDYTVSGLIDDYGKVQLQFGEQHYPSYAAAIYFDVVGAVRDALRIRLELPHVKLFYNGQELLGEFDSWRSLARLIHEFYDEWAVTEEVADGTKSISELRREDYSDVLWAVLMKIAEEIDQPQLGT